MGKPNDDYDDQQKNTHTKKTHLFLGSQEGGTCVSARSDFESLGFSGRLLPQPGIFRTVVLS